MDTEKAASGVVPRVGNSCVQANEMRETKLQARKVCEPIKAVSRKTMQVGKAYAVEKVEHMTGRKAGGGDKAILQLLCG